MQKENILHQKSKLLSLTVATLRDFFSCWCWGLFEKSHCCTCSNVVVKNWYFKFFWSEIEWRQRAASLLCMCFHHREESLAWQGGISHHELITLHLSSAKTELFKWLHFDFCRWKRLISKVLCTQINRGKMSDQKSRKGLMINDGPADTQTYNKNLYWNSPFENIKKNYLW